MHKSLEVLLADHPALCIITFCSACDMASLQLICRGVYTVVQHQASRILRTLYDLPFPTPSRFHTDDALQLIALCERTGTLLLNLTALGVADPTPTTESDSDDQLTVTSLDGHTAFSCATAAGAQAEATPFVPFVLTHEPVPLPNGEVDARACCYDDFVTEVSDGLYKGVPHTVVLSSGVVLFVGEAHEWDNYAGTPEASCSSTAPALYLHQAQRHSLPKVAPPLRLPFAPVRDLLDMGGGGVAVAGEAATLVLRGAVRPHPAKPRPRGPRPAHTTYRTPPLWTLSHPECGLLPFAAADAVLLPDGHVAALRGAEVQEWRPGGGAVRAPPWRPYEWVATTALPLDAIAPPPPPPAVGRRPAGAAAPPRIDAAALPLQFAAAGVVVGAVGSRVWAWRVGGGAPTAVGEYRPGQRLQVVRPPDSTFFAVAPAAGDKAGGVGLCRLVDLRSLAVLREVALGGLGVPPAAFGPNLLVLPAPGRLVLFDHARSLAVPTPWRPPEFHLCCPLSATALVCGAPRRLCFLLTDPARAKARKALLRQQPPRPATPPPLPRAPATAERSPNGPPGAARGPRRRWGGWTEEEDEALRTGVAEHGEGRWAQLAARAPPLAARDGASLEARWATLRRRAEARR